MNDAVQTRTNRLESALSSFALPAVLTVNTVALVALEQLGGIPQWVKAAVALFLAF